jgi:hypothetical protein
MNSRRRVNSTVVRLLELASMNRFAIVALVVGMAVAAPQETTAAKNGPVSVRLTINGCYESEDLSVPINRSFRRRGIGIGGGGNGSCHYSYNLDALRLGRNRVRLDVSVTVAGRSLEKQIILTRGKPFDAQLDLGVRLRAHY